MFHICAFTTATTAAATLQDMTAAVDPSLSARNGHFIFTEQYSLLAACATGALITQIEFKSPSINAIAPWNIYPPNLAVTISANPNIADYRNYRPPMPINEEIQVLTTASGAEQENAFLFLGTPGWTADLGALAGTNPMSDGTGRRLLLQSTVAVTKVANAWSTDGAVTFEQSLRAGNYAVLGCYGILAGVLAFRVNFLRAKMGPQGRKLFPGDIANQAYANAPNRLGVNWLGIWGFFHNFEPPVVAVWGNAAGAATLTLLWDVVYMGGNQDATPVLYNSIS